MFHRDVFLPVPLIADLQALQQRRQLKVDQDLLRRDWHRLCKDCQPGDQVIVIDKGIKHKLGPAAIGPHAITEIHTNGTAVIQCHPDVFERIGIGRLKPCNQWQG